MPKYTNAVAVVNIYGPDGDLCPAGLPLPQEWPYDFIDELVRTGGASVVDEEEE